MRERKRKREEEGEGEKREKRKDSLRVGEFISKLLSIVSDYVYIGIILQTAIHDVLHEYGEFFR